MKKIIVSILLLLSLFLITGCGNKNKISDITKKLGDRVEIRLVNNQTGEDYLVANKFKNVILELLNEVTYKEYSDNKQVNRLVGLYSLELKGNIKFVVNEAYLVVADERIQIESTNPKTGLKAVIDVVKREVIKSKYLMMDNDTFNIYTSVEELVNVDFSYDKKIYNEAYFEKKILVTFDFKKDSTESNLKCVKAHTLGPIIYLDFEIDSQNPYFCDGQMEISTVLVEVEKPTTLRGNSLAITVVNTNPLFVGEYNSCFYDCRKIGE